VKLLEPDRTLISWWWTGSNGTQLLCCSKMVSRQQPMLGFAHPPDRYWWLGK